MFFYFTIRAILFVNGYCYFVKNSDLGFYIPHQRHQLLHDFEVIFSQFQGDLVHWPSAMEIVHSENKTKGKK